ncbi:MAG: YihY/virulence factor BrkB family protein [Ardenticatenaceae bacterium]|nr:YihY/virulence factor BrkB family protein [Anaerolineales bacterium]MCB8922848.1 YihY/virulence factor BrkB family protein [Ardenticatenaceae bacterium]MCB9005427.1 YihY/virulence factor BrkB family protein [Ardenticatenaceae bacterium]
MKYLKILFELVKETAVSYGRDKGGLLAAALAYHTIFSLAPLLVIAVAVAGFVFGDAAVKGELVGLIEGTVGTEAAVVIQNLIGSASQGSGEIFATIISTGLLFLGATGVFGQLKTALNMTWGISRGPDKGIWAMLKTRFLAILMVMGIGFLLLTAIFTSTILTTVNRRLAAQGADISAALPLINFLATFTMLTLLFAIIFKTLPDASVAWKDALVGGAVTSILFGIGQYVIGLYLATSSVGSAYGAASSLVVVLFWIYISAQILMFGAEFTQVYANRYGSKIRPSQHAILLQNNVQTPEPEPIEEVEASLMLYPLEEESQPRPAPTWQRQTAVGLLGMAAGLFLGFIGSLLRDQS